MTPDSKDIRITIQRQWRVISFFTNNTFFSACNLQARSNPLILLSLLPSPPLLPHLLLPSLFPNGSVRLYPINDKTAEPIRSKFVVGREGIGKSPIQTRQIHENILTLMKNVDLKTLIQSKNYYKKAQLYYIIIYVSMKDSGLVVFFQCKMWL